MSEDRISVGGSWDLTPKELAALFKHQNWYVDFGDGEARTPTPEEIAGFYGDLFRELHDGPDDRNFSLQRTRFVALKDAELPRSVTIALVVGLVWNDDELEPEQRERLGLDP